MDSDLTVQLKCNKRKQTDEQAKLRDVVLLDSHGKPVSLQVNTMLVKALDHERMTVKARNASESLQTYLVGNNLRFELTIEQSRNKKCQCNLLDSFCAARFTDVVLTTDDGRSWACHRHILAERSDYFVGLFSSDMRESKEDSVTLKGIENQVLEFVLKYIYSYDVTSVDKCSTLQVEKIIAVADMLQLLELRKMCGKFLIEHMSVQRAALQLVLANLHQCSELENRLLIYISVHAEEVVRSRAWNDLMAAGFPVVSDIEPKLPPVMDKVAGADPK